MALQKKDFWQYGILGFVLAYAIVPTLKIVSNTLSLIPGLDVSLQSVSVSGNVSGAFTKGIADLGTAIFSKLPIDLTGVQWLLLGLGGAAFVILGAFLVDLIGQLKGSKMWRLSLVLIVASVISGWILSMNLSIPALAAIITLGINALILSWIIVTIDEFTKINLVP